MPIIRRKYNYRKVYISNTILSESYPACGKTVESYVAGKPAVIPFDGFVDWDEFSGDGTIITSIEAFTPDDSLAGQWTEYKATDWFLGQENHDGVSLVLYEGLPVKIGESDVQVVAVKPNNVTSLGQHHGR